jgi:hypothetical protein
VPFVGRRVHRMKTISRMGPTSRPLRGRGFDPGFTDPGHSRKYREIPTISYKMLEPEA